MTLFRLSLVVPKRHAPSRGLLESLHGNLTSSVTVTRFYNLDIFTVPVNYSNNVHTNPDIFEVTVDVENNEKKMTVSPLFGEFT